MLQRQWMRLTLFILLVGVVAAAGGLQTGERSPAPPPAPPANAARPGPDEQQQQQAGGTERGPSSAPSDREGAIQRGRYLVHDVAMCAICHSPHSSVGELDARRLLHGGRIPLESPFPRQEWAFTAPRLAGLPGGWTEGRLIELLMTGRRPEGPAPRPPMPPFRMNREDAAAVAAYLKSLE
jgi:mono/diheme cytochrome c family protein